MTNPKHTDTSRSGDLVERLRERTCVVFNSPGVHPDTECLEAADRIEALEARVAGLTHERDFHRETADLHADRIEALEAALSWALIQLGSETGYNMESPIWHAYDRARDVLNGVRK